MYRPTLANTLLSLFALSSLSNTAHAMSYHDNKVTFVTSTSKWANFQGSHYTLTGVSVTPGQDPDGNLRAGQGYTLQPEGTGGSISLRVGRKKSSGVASWWNSAVGDPSHSTFNHAPDELNFATIGNLAMYQSNGAGGAYNLQDITLGQGSAGSANNWWFGGKNCKYVASYVVTCTGYSATNGYADFHFVRGGTTQNVDQIELVDVTFYGV